MNVTWHLSVSHICRQLVGSCNESVRWFTTYIWLICTTSPYTHESDVTYSYLIASCHVWMSHVAYVMSHVNEPCHIRIRYVTYEWVISLTNEPCNIWVSHITHKQVMSHVNGSRHMWMSHSSWTHFSICSNLNDTHISHMNESCYIWLLWMLKCAHEPWLIQMWHDSFTCDMTRWMPHIFHIWMSHVT